MVNEDTKGLSEWLKTAQIRTINPEVCPHLIYRAVALPRGRDVQVRRSEGENHAVVGLQVEPHKKRWV